MEIAIDPIDVIDSSDPESSSGEVCDQWLKHLSPGGVKVLPPLVDSESSGSEQGRHAADDPDSDLESSAADYAENWLEYKTKCERKGHNVSNAND